MAKKTIVDGPVETYGPCKECSKSVDVLVEMHQVVGLNRVICIDCRIGRIEAKAALAIETIRQNTTKAREAAAQGLLELPDEGEGSE